MQIKGDDSSDNNVVPAHGNRRHSNLSNLEKNCSQIFAKAPAITREFIDKINNEVVPQKTNLFGYQMNTRRFIVLTGLILLFTFSTMGTITMWFTTVFQKRVESMMTLSEESIGYELWRKPSPKPYFKIYIFNYTNVEEFELGQANKLHVEEVGPYVYFEELERVNVRFNKVDGTISYQEKRTYKFSPELSKGSPDDSLTIPNVPLLSGAAVVKKFNFVLRLGYNGLLQALSERPFKTLLAKNFVTGYDDHLYDLSKNYLKYEDKRTFDHFGILVWKQGTQPDIYTMNTGTHDINKLGQIEKFNGLTHFDTWGSESCNRVQSSDGIIYPSNLVKAKKDLAVFIPQMCRKVKLQFAEENVMLDKVPVYRYKIPLDVFDSQGNEDNECYCDQIYGTCPPKGLFNATTCTFGAPIFYSWPHLYNADPAIQEGVTGLHKNPVLNDTYVDIHPKLGVAMKGRLKIQINVRIEKSFGVSELNRYPDALMLPLVWVDTGLEEEDLPEHAVNMINHMTFTIRSLELGFKYGCLLTTMVTFTCILLVLKKQRESKSRVDSIQRPIISI